MNLQCMKFEDRSVLSCLCQVQVVKRGCYKHQMLLSSRCNIHFDRPARHVPCLPQSLPILKQTTIVILPYLYFLHPSNCPNESKHSAPKCQTKLIDPNQGFPSSIGSTRQSRIKKLPYVYLCSPVYTHVPFGSLSESSPGQGTCLVVRWGKKKTKLNQRVLL